MYLKMKTHLYKERFSDKFSFIKSLFNFRSRLTERSLPNNASSVRLLRVLAIQNHTLRRRNSNGIKMVNSQPELRFFL